MAYIMNIFAGILGVYTVLICIRILLTWFPGADFGRPYLFLCSICDPYLDWFRRFRIFKNSPIDFSPVIALGALSLLNRILLSWAGLGRISIAAVLIMFLEAGWSIVSWVLGFIIIILVLRMAAFLGNCNIYSPFWRFIDFIAQPVLYRINRIFFSFRIVGFLFRIIFSIAVLAAAGGLIRVLVYFATLFIRMIPF